MTRPLCRIAGSLSIASLLLYAFAGVALWSALRIGVSPPHGFVRLDAGCSRCTALVSDSSKVSPI